MKGSDSRTKLWSTSSTGSSQQDLATTPTATTSTTTTPYSVQQQFAMETGRNSTYDEDTTSRTGSTVNLLLTGGGGSPGPGAGGGGLKLTATAADKPNHIPPTGSGYGTVRSGGGSSCTIHGFNGESDTGSCTVNSHSHSSHFTNGGSTTSSSSSKGNYFFGSSSGNSTGCHHHSQQQQYHHHHHPHHGSGGGSATVFARCCLYLTKGLNLRLCAGALVIVTIVSMLCYNYYMDSSPIAR